MDCPRNVVRSEEDEKYKNKGKIITMQEDGTKDKNQGNIIKMPRIERGGETSTTMDEEQKETPSQNDEKDLKENLENEKEKVKRDVFSFIASIKIICKFVIKYKTTLIAISAVFVVIVYVLYKLITSRFDQLDTLLQKNGESVSSQITALDSKLDSQIAALDTQITALDTQIEDLDTKWEIRFDDLSKEFYELKGEVNGIQAVPVAPGFVRAAISCVSNAEDSIEIDKSMVVRNDDNGENIIVASAVENKKLLLTYDVNGTNNLFYGSFNKYGHWDGRCLINTYKDKLLYALTDATYDDGKLIGCQRIYVSNVSGEKVWTISKTIVSDNKHVEVSKSFIREKEIPLNFSMDEATMANLLNVSDVKRYFGRQISYYSGFSEQGRPNDSSGNAFWIKFDEQGKITVFQNGIFSNGMLNDHNDKDGVTSWEIVWSNDYNK